MSQKICFEFQLVKSQFDFWQALVAVFQVLVWDDKPIRIDSFILKIPNRVVNLSIVFLVLNKARSSESRSVWKRVY